MCYVGLGKATNKRLHDTMESKNNVEMPGNTKIEMLEKACVLGTGAFGTALAQLMARQGVPTTAWTRSEDVSNLINRCVFSVKALYYNRILTVSNCVRYAAGVASIGNIWSCRSLWQ